MIKNSQASFKSAQKGVVLFVALIALVVMALASVALIRSVDTNTQIAGNLSFKQSALISSDRGVESAMAWLEQTANLNLTSLNSSIPANGYYAVYGDLSAGVAATPINLDDRAAMKAGSTWTTYGVKATGSNITAGEDSDTKNTIEYIIERMCTKEAVPENDATNQCLFGASEPGGGSKGVKDAEQAGAIIDSSASPIYRVTVRVTGPRNTLSYSQAYAY